MSHVITDGTLIDEICNKYTDFIKKECEKTFLRVSLETGEQSKIKFSDLKFDFPLDTEVIERLSSLKPSGKHIEYTHAAELDELWYMLIEKSIKCLRFFDEREPFIEKKEKTPMAYGLDKLKAYHQKYTDFESLLYGASSYYRDHVFHAIRVWMLGIFCLLYNSKSSLINEMQLDGASQPEFLAGTNFFEKISMWTIIALCHDLGYPLEKSQQILDKTQNMMTEFIPNPNIWNNFSFTGMQDNINDYYLRFISTKMKEKSKPFTDATAGPVESGTSSCIEYTGRIQPKYYLKYAKSLEKYEHGIIGAVVVYKMLLYFLESDFNLNDDYVYTFADARQFYLRREILRAMSSHTCHDVYNININTFSSLLLLCDEFQEWGRKSWNDLYIGINPNGVELTIDAFSSDKIAIREEIDMTSIDQFDTIISNIENIYHRQYEVYKLVFRDGQYTNSRKFDFQKTMTLKLKQEETKKREATIVYSLSPDKKDSFKVSFTIKTDKSKFQKGLKKELCPELSC